MKLRESNDALRAEVYRLKRCNSRLEQTNRALLRRADRAETERREMARYQLASELAVESVAEFLSGRGSCDGCRRALRDLARLELAA